MDKWTPTYLEENLAMDKVTFVYSSNASRFVHFSDEVDNEENAKRVQDLLGDSAVWQPNYKLSNWTLKGFFNKLNNETDQEKVYYSGPIGLWPKV